MSVKKDRPLNILHLASFSGNIGDTANHQGFYQRLTEKIPATFTPLEIRRFYKNRAELAFDEAFVENVNQYDALVLGGGGFFDLRWDDSHTGTTINLSKQLIQAIRVPVLVNAMGYHEIGEAKPGNLVKFKNFIEDIAHNENWLLTVRNDGTHERMRRRCGAVMDNVQTVPDSGFFYAPEDDDRCQLAEPGTTWIGLNITNDQFSKEFNHDLDLDAFNAEMRIFVTSLLRAYPNCKLLFFPHAHQDIETICKLMQGLDEKDKRERMVIAPLFLGGKSVERLFNLYRLCACVVAMRFHANVCSIGMNVPTVALAGHEQIWGLYTELGLASRCVKADHWFFTEEVFALVKDTLQRSTQISQEYAAINQRLSAQGEAYFTMVADWLRSSQV